jgi:hypothetical protein
VLLTSVIRDSMSAILFEDGGKKVGKVQTKGYVGRRSCVCAAVLLLCRRMVCELPRQTNGDASRRCRDY